MQLVPVKISDGQVDAIAVTFYPAYGEDGEAFTGIGRLNLAIAYLGPQVRRVSKGFRLKGKQKREANAHYWQCWDAFWAAVKAK